jgi:Uma2 family endonuclease
MQQARIKFTYSDYVLLPEQDRRELIYGDFYVVPAPNIRHQVIIRNLAPPLHDHVRENGLGEVLWAPVDVVLSEESVVQPDILFVSGARYEIITEANIQGAPDLVVEVLSPSTADRDRRLKLSLYARFGVREYWIVDPEEESIQVLELGPGGRESTRTYTSGVATSSVVAGFEIEVGRIFAE